MSQRSIAHNHAVFVPRPAVPRPAARSHARPMDPVDVDTPLPKPVARRRAAPIERPLQRRDGAAPVRVRSNGVVARRPRPARRLFGVSVDAPGQVAILVCALGALFVTVLLGLFSLLQRTVPHGAIQGVFPFLLGGTLLILLRGHVNIARYWEVRRRVGLTSGHWTDHALTALYGLAFFFAAAVVAALIACGAAALIGGFV